MAPARSRNAPTKKHVLTLAQIASYDDILTDSLVDHVRVLKTMLAKLGLLSAERLFTSVIY